MARQSKKNQNEEQSEEKQKTSEGGQTKAIRHNGNGHAAGHEGKTSQPVSENIPKAARKNREGSHAYSEGERESQSRGQQNAEKKYSKGHSEEDKYTTYDYDRDHYGRSERRRSVRRRSDYGYASEAGRYNEIRPYPSARYYQGDENRNEPRNRYANEQEEECREYYPTAYGSYRYEDRNRYPGRQQEEFLPQYREWEERGDAPSRNYSRRRRYEVGERYPEDEEEYGYDLRERSIHSDWYGDTRPEYGYRRKQSRR